MLPLNMHLLAAMMAWFELGQSAEWTGPGPDRKPFAALLALTFRNSALNQLFTGEKFLLKEVNQEQCGHYREQHNEVMPDRHKFKRLKEIDKPF